MYGFNRQKMFKAGYMVRNNRSSQKHRRYNKRNMDQKGLLLVKNKFDKNHCVVSLRPRSQTYDSIHFLSYNCHAGNLGIDSRFNDEL